MDTKTTTSGTQRGGEFLPLSVWGTRGWDTDAIEKNSYEHDKRVCRVAGLTYRVPIYSAGRAGKKGTSREDREQTTGTRKKKKTTDDDAGAASPSEDDESSSDSSSSSKKRGKKDKKSKKEKRRKEKAAKKQRKDKEREKTRRQEEAKAKKNKEATKKLALVLKDKVRTTKVQVKDVIGEPQFTDLPIVVKDALTETYDKVKQIDKDITAILEGRDVTISHISSAAECKALLADVKRKMDNTKGILSQVGRF